MKSFILKTGDLICDIEGELLILIPKEIANRETEELYDPKTRKHVVTTIGKWMEENGMPYPEFSSDASFCGGFSFTTTKKDRQLLTIIPGDTHRFLFDSDHSQFAAMENNIQETKEKSFVKLRYRLNADPNRFFTISIYRVTFEDNEKLELEDSLPYLGGNL